VAVSRRALFAVIVAAVYAAACAWALWSALWATLLLIAVSPVAAGFLSAKTGDGRVMRFMAGAVIDAIMAAVAIDLPIAGDALDGAILLVAAIAMFGKIKRFVVDVPVGLAWLVLVVILWTERYFLPHASSGPGIAHEWWFHPAVALAGVATGCAVLAALTALLGLIGDRDYPKALFRVVGYPWYVLAFVITFMVPDKRVKAARRRQAK
jgi:hypothetical protein